MSSKQNVCRPAADVLAQVRRTVQEHGLLANGDTVVVGVSGGPDSLCLLHVLMRLREEHNARLHVAHLNHGARGAESDRDAEFVRARAAEWGLPCTVEKEDVPALARERRLAFEETARRVRYAFLARVAGEIGAARIAVGHNADDQAETVLMHFIRGSGPAGLRGMLPLTPITDYRLLEPFSKGVAATSQQGQPPCIIRPLMETARADIEAYCRDYGLEPRFDRSNLDTTYFRNRLRHDLLPVLETHNPNVKARLCHTAAVVAADYELLDGLAAQAWNEAVRDARQERVVFDRKVWQALPVGLQRATLRRAVHHLRESLRDVDFVHVEDARRVALYGQTGAQATLPSGLVLVVEYDTLTVGSHGDAGPPPPDGPLLWGDEPVVVQVPGMTPLPSAPSEAYDLPNWMLGADLLDEWSMHEIAANLDPWVAYLDAAALAAPLVLRGRRRGERFRPQGMAGHRVKVSDYLVNRKVPRAWRDHLPLLVAGDVILWVCGHSVAAEGAISEDTHKVVRLRFDRL